MKIELQIDHRYTDNDNEEHEFHVTGKIGEKVVDENFEYGESAAYYIDYYIKQQIFLELC